MSARALVYVQHLLGIGHLARINRIARALHAAGVQTTLVQGGPDAGLPPVKGVDLIRLAPVKVTASDMTTLLHADGRVFTEADKASRRDHLLAVLSRTRPDILLLEAFPFGRRQMRFELMPLLDEARAMNVPVIAASIRDLLQESRKPGRAEETVNLVNSHFDLVLVHGDEELTPLARTFPLAHTIADRTHYSGLVGPEAPVTVHRKYAVVVSAGGGVVGAHLLEAAIRSVPMTPFRDDPWLVLAGPNLPEADFVKLQTLAADTSTGIEVIRSVTDLPAYLAGARISISQAGYNTVADILVAGCAAVLVPFSLGGETEQTMRAEALAASGRAICVREHNLDPASIAAAIRHAVALPEAPALQLDGGPRTVAILLASLVRKKAVTSATGKRIESRSRLLSSFAGEHS
jgi:predicted glycosyltransferase